MSSTQKVVIVTGASQGIGEALVTAYGKLGYAVVATHRPRRQCVARPRGHHSTPRPGWV